MISFPSVNESKEPNNLLFKVERTEDRCSLLGCKIPRNLYLNKNLTTPCTKMYRLLSFARYAV